MSTISIWCERQTASFTKSFKKRYVTFEIESRRLSYAQDNHKPPRDTIVVTNVLRVCQTMEIKAHELFTLIIDGKREDGKEEHWTLRMPDRQVFDEWTKILWTACAYAGLMEPFNCGLPPVDPRTRLPFAQVPPEHLFTFSLLEKAVIYFFDSVTLLTSMVGKDSHSGRHRLVVGDKAVYVFDNRATILCCSHISDIRAICHSPDANFFAINVKPPAQDIVVKDLVEGVQLATIFDRLFYVVTKQNLRVIPINVPTVELLVESQQLRLTADEGYNLSVIPPTNKIRLCQKIDAGYDGIDGSTKTGLNSCEEEQKQKVSDEPTAVTFNCAETNEPLVLLLRKVGLPEYTSVLSSQHVDLDVLQCMDASDLMTFGIKNEEHCKRILDAASNMDTSILENLDYDESLPDVNLKPAVNATATGGVTLSDDDDDDIDLLLLQPRGQVVLDDDFDDDLLSPLPAAPNTTKPTFVIDDDDDL